MLNKTDIQKLFLLMQARYGHKWTSNYDDPEVVKVAVNEWLRGLKEFPADWIHRGTVNWKGDWPPSLPEFQKACLPSFKELGFDLFKEAEKRASNGDMYGWKRLPAEKQDKRYSAAEKEVIAEMQADMISHPNDYEVENLLEDQSGRLQ